MRFIAVLLLTAVFLFSCSQKDITVTSPDGKVTVSLSAEADSLFFSAKFDDTPLLNKSVLGLKVNGTDFTGGIAVADIQKSEFDETWNTVNGKQRKVRNHYKELKLKVQKKEEPQKFYEIIFRVYNDGFAYRYNFPNEAVKSNVLIEDELTDLQFADDFTYWTYK
jgi:alpha-glucosidase